MNVSRQSLFQCLAIVWVMHEAVSLHVLPRMIERFHNADSEEAKRIALDLTDKVSQTGFFRERPKTGYRIKVNSHQQNHKISPSLLKLNPIPENPRSMAQPKSDGQHELITPIKLSEKAFPQNKFSLVDQPVASEAAKKQIAEGERKLILAQNPNGNPEITAHFETIEIKDALYFVEFKMEEMNSLMTECINQEFQKNIQATAADIKKECVGATFQILFYNYREALAKVKDILLELLKMKLEPLREDFEDETNFFLDMIENLIDKDYSINGSIEIAKKAARYYVTPRYFEALMGLVAPEINAFDEIHDRLKKSRRDIHSLLVQKAKEDEAYVAQLQAEINNVGGRKLNEDFTAKSEVPPSRYLKSLPSEPTISDSATLGDTSASQHLNYSLTGPHLARLNSASLQTKGDKNLI